MVAGRSGADPKATRAGFDVVRVTLDATGVSLIALYLGVFASRNVTIQGDFRTYLLAARAAVAGLDPYRPEDLAALAGRGTVPFVYPPITLLAFVPLAKLSFGAAAALWMGLKISLLAGLIGMWLK